jgi:hypothetical protein
MNAELTKAAKKIRCRSILQRGPHRVKDEDALFLLTDVFPLHHNWSEKSESGIDHIEVRKSPGVFGSFCFFLVRKDGEQLDISYRTAIDGAQRVYATFVGAARNEILGQISDWKRANPPPGEGMHCDHIEPFDALLKSWLTGVVLRPEEIGVIKQKVGHLDLFASRELALSWQRFHKHKATYQWLTREANVQKSNTVSDVEAWIAEYDRASRTAA